MVGCPEVVSVFPFPDNRGSSPGLMSVYHRVFGGFNLQGTERFTSSFLSITFRCVRWKLGLEWLFGLSLDGRQHLLSGQAKCHIKWWVGLPLCHVGVRSNLFCEAPNDMHNGTPIVVIHGRTTSSKECNTCYIILCCEDLHPIYGCLPPHIL